MAISLDMRFIIYSLCIVISCIFQSCKENPQKMDIKTQKVKVEDFGMTPQGKASLFTITNKNGIVVKITNYGGIITSILTPDKDGNMGDIVMGFDNLEGYLGEHPFFGSIVGRYGNRIANGEFSLDGVTYTLAKNNGAHHLHGGNVGFDKKLWDAEVIEDGVQLKYLSKDMEEGYPGNLDITVLYTLDDDNELWIKYRATTDKPTLCNLTNHTYFNLKGSGSIADHRMIMTSDRYTPTDKELIPTGEIVQSEGTPFNIKGMMRIGDGLESDHPQILLAGGYDHNFVLRKSSSNYDLAATVIEESTGRMLQVLTTEPGVQFYTGNFLDGTITGKNGQLYQKNAGFCLETQHYPNSPNQENFPSTVLKPGQKYSSMTTFRFIAQ